MLQSNDSKRFAISTLDSAATPAARQHTKAAQADPTVAPGVDGAATATDSAPGFVLVKAKGGMGNRLLCAMTGLAYAQLAGRRCVVDWTDITYSNTGENAFPRFFECDGVEPLETLPQRGEIQPSVWDDHRDYSVSQMLHTYDPKRHSSVTIGRKYSVNPRQLGHPAPVVVYWSYTERFYALRRHLQRNNAWPDTSREALRHTLRNKLRLQSAIQQQVDEFAGKHFRPRMIGLHLRCTDRTMSIEKPLQIVKDLQARHPDAGLFVATDNREVLNRLEAECSDVVSTPKWYPDDGSAMHQNDSCPDRYQNGVEALLDMWLLSRCDHLVYASRSTFSYVSALLSDAPESQVIDVDRLNPKINLKRLIRRLCE